MIRVFAAKASRGRSRSPTQNNPDSNPTSHDSSVARDKSPKRRSSPSPSPVGRLRHLASNHLSLMQGLPKTLAKLVDRLEKSVATVVAKNTAIESAKVPHLRTIGEIKALLETINNIINRIIERVTTNPAKAIRLYSTSPLHAGLVRGVRGLLPSGWLYAEAPDLAKQQVDLVEMIVLRCGVSRWDWLQGSTKSNFVPLVLQAMVLYKGSPLDEPETATRLIEMLIRAGATADPFDKSALVARAQQCNWPSSEKLIGKIGEDSLEAYKPKESMKNETETAETDGADSIAEERKDAVQGIKDGGKESDEMVDVDDEGKQDKSAEPEVIVEELVKLREKSEMQLKKAEEKLKRIQESRQVADEQAAARLLELADLDRVSFYAELSDDDADYEEVDMEKLVAEEMDRIRVEATVKAKGTIEDEGSVLKKLYDLFSSADSGRVDVADAGLTDEEFANTISVAKLQEILAPIGGLDLSRIDPELTKAQGVKVPIELVFKTLDRDGNSRVTATEFIKLLKEKAPTTYKEVVEDDVLGKLYKLFSNADAGVVDVADAGLSAWEFEAGISVSQLEEALGPIGTLDLSKLNPEIQSTGASVGAIFKALDRNGDDRVTATEFIQLLKTRAPNLAE